MPPVTLTSDALESLLEPVYERLRLPAGRLELMTGIRERRFWAEPMPASRASALAGEKALAKSRVPRDQIDLLLHCAVCRDQLEPATASTVHQLLGLPAHTQIFDVSNACLGFLNGMVTAAGLIQSRQIRAALIVSGENGKPLLDRTIETLLNGTFTRKSIKPYFANLTIGAGAAAAVLCSASMAGTAPRIVCATVETDTSHNHLCQGDSSRGDGLEMVTESELLLDAGISVAERGWERFCNETGWSSETVDRIVCHQVGRAHQRRLLAGLKIAPEKDYITYPELGNIGSASLPITLCRALESGAMHSTDSVGLLGIGSGIVSMMVAVQA